MYKNKLRVCSMYPALAAIHIHAVGDRHIHNTQLGLIIKINYNLVKVYYFY